MPTYEYECQNCGARCEFFQPMGSAPKKTCPHCKKRKLVRLIGAGAGILFKGSGFYETDYRSADYKKRSSEDAAPGKDSSSGAGDGAGKKGGAGASTGSASKKSGAANSSGSKSD